MILGIKILVGVMSLPLLGLGIRTILKPKSMTDFFAVEPRGKLGMATLRGTVGGVLLGSALMILMGLWKQDTAWFLATALMMGVIIFGRLISLALDGFETKMLAPIVIESVIVGVMFLGHNKLFRDKLS